MLNGVPKLDMKELGLPKFTPTVITEARATLADLRQLFDDLDADFSGELEADELQELLKRFLKQGGVMPSSKLISQTMAKSLSKYATPGSTALEFHQFVAFFYSEEELQHHTRNVEPQATNHALSSVAASSLLSVVER